MGSPSFSIEPPDTAASSFSIEPPSSQFLQPPPGATAMQAQPAPTGIADRLTQWGQNVANDIKNGTDLTGVGTVLKKMGAHGVYQGQPEAVGDFMASLPLGLAKMAQGTGQVGQGQIKQGVGNVISGGLQAATLPTAFASPEVAATGEQAVQKAAEAIPSAKRAGQAFQDVSAAVGQHTVPITNDLSDALQKISTLAKSGLTMPKVAGDFIERTANLDMPPINYNEARDFYSTLADKLSPDEAMKLTPRMRFALGQFKSALNDTISDTAGAAGKLDQYKGAMSEYRNAMRLRGAGESITDALKNYGAKVAAGGAFGLGGKAAYDAYRAAQK